MVITALPCTLKLEVGCGMVQTQTSKDVLCKPHEDEAKSYRNFLGFNKLVFLHD